MSESYHTWKPKSELGEQVSGSSPDAVAVSGFIDAEAFIVPSGYTLIFDGKRQVMSGFEGAESYHGVKPGDYPDNENDRQKRTVWVYDLKCRVRDNIHRQGVHQT